MSLLPAAAHMLITSPSSSSPSCEHAAARTIWTLAGCAELRNSRGSVALFTHPNIDARRQHNEHHRRRLSVCQFDLACFASFLYFRILALHLPTMESAAENQVGAPRPPWPSVAAAAHTRRCRISQSPRASSHPPGYPRSSRKSPCRPPASPPPPPLPHGRMALSS